MRLLTNFGSDIFAIDLGTVNTLIAIKGKGVVLNEATAVAVSSDNEREILAVGNDAIETCGRTPNGVQLLFPFRRGVIADYRLAEHMLREFMIKAMESAGIKGLLFGPKVLLCVPGCITDVERNALEVAARNSGIREVRIIEESLAAAIGADLPYCDAVASLVVDIGGGTTDAAVITLGGVAAHRSERVGGNNMNDAVATYIRKKQNIVIGARSAQMLIHKLSECGNKDKHPIEIRGLSLDTGLPQSSTVEPKEILEALNGIIEEIVTIVKDLLSVTPPELASDCIKSGITLTGGGAMLFDIDRRIEKATGIHTQVAQRPFECVILGALSIIESTKPSRMQDIGIGNSVLKMTARNR